MKSPAAAVLSLAAAGGLLLAFSGKGKGNKIPPKAGPDLAPFKDVRRLKTLDGILPAVRPHFQALLTEAARLGMEPHIVSALRTCEEQENLAATKTRKSWHCLGRAVDVELQGRIPEGESPDSLYRRLGEWWEARGGNWGGRWTDLYPVAPGVPGAAGDPMHFQMSDGRDAVPAGLWPDGASCEAVVDSYLRKNGSLWTPSQGWLDSGRAA